MKRLSLLVLALCCAGLVAALDAAENQPQPKPEEVKATPPERDILLKAVGLTVMRPAPDDGRNVRFWFGPWHTPGTTLTFRASTAKGTVIGINMKASKLMLFQDDLGTVIVPPTGMPADNPEQAPGQPWVRQWQMRQEPGGDFLFMIGSSVPPAEGALHLVLRAEVVLTYAATMKTAKSEHLEPKSGTKLKIGEVQMEIVENPQGAGGFGLKWRDDDETLQNRIKGIRFLREDGSEVQGFQSGSGSSVSNGRVEMTWYYTLREEVKKVTIELIYFDEIKQVTMPIDIQCGVGL